jgi:ATP-dependent helicase/DNAse subunit B
MEIARQEFTNTEKQGITGRPLMWQMAREEIEQELVAFLDADSTLRGENGLKTIHVERAFGFGKEGNLPPVVVKIGAREIRLHGLIDRVDSNRSGDQVYVIDYKTGGIYSYYGMKKNPLDHGKHLQLPVYSMAVRGSLEKPANIRACYWFISTKGNFERREVELSSVEAKFIDDLQIIASDIENGVYPANPGKEEKENCGYCDFERICAADRDLMWRRKAGAPELKSYLRLIDDEPDEEESE